MSASSGTGLCNVSNPNSDHASSTSSRDGIRIGKYTVNIPRMTELLFMSAIRFVYYDNAIVMHELLWITRCRFVITEALLIVPDTERERGLRDYEETNCLLTQT